MAALIIGLAVAFIIASLLLWGLHEMNTHTRPQRGGWKPRKTPPPPMVRTLGTRQLLDDLTGPRLRYVPQQPSRTALPETEISPWP